MPETTKRRRLIYEYFDIDVPADWSEDPQERADQAIFEAREKASWAVPADWTVLSDDGHTVRVRRRRPNIRQKAA